ncbi:MAG: hypothetical protein AAF715_23495 [Myxococcota bacterium]
MRNEDFNDEPFDPSIRMALQSSRLLETVMKRGVPVGKSLEDAGMPSPGVSCGIASGLPAVVVHDDTSPH